MKLKTLNEARHSSHPGNVPLTMEAFKRVKSIKPDLTKDQFAKFAAHLEYETLYKDPNEIEWVLYNGIVGMKNDPKAIEHLLEMFMDDDYNEREWVDAWEVITNSAKKFFRGHQTTPRR